MIKEAVSFLAKNEEAVLLSSSAWLDDSHINGVMQMMADAFPQQSGLQYMHVFGDSISMLKWGSHKLCARIYPDLSTYRRS